MSHEEDEMPRAQRRRTARRPRGGALLALCALVCAIAAMGCSCRHKARGDPNRPVAQRLDQVLEGDAAMRCPTALTAARRGGAEAGRYVVPSEADRIALGNAAEKLVREGASARSDVSAILATAGFELVDVAEIPGA